MKENLIMFFRLLWLVVKVPSEFRESFVTLGKKLASSDGKGEECHAQLVRFLKGEPCNIKIGDKKTRFYRLLGDGFVYLISLTSPYLKDGRVCSDLDIRKVAQRRGPQLMRKRISH